MLFDCIDRAMKRKGHETLYGDPKLIASVIIRCFHQYKGINFDNQFLESKGIEELIEIPFIKEIPRFQKVMGKDMVDELELIFSEFAPGQLIPLPRVKKILKLFMSLNGFFKFPKR